MRNGQPVRDAILAAITIVTHYEDKSTGRDVSLQEAQSLPRNSLRSAGLPYWKCLEIVKVRVPWSKTNGDVLRWTAHQVRIGASGFAGHELPQRRPHDDGINRERAPGRRLGRSEARPKFVNYFIMLKDHMAEREGFEPPIRLPVCRISSAVHSTTLPPLRI